jgi:hypothetical protein
VLTPGAGVKGGGGLHRSGTWAQPIGLDAGEGDAEGTMIGSWP